MIIYLFILFFRGDYGNVKLELIHTLYIIIRLQKYLLSFSEENFAL